jgi:hypothetical protein
VPITVIEVIEAYHSTDPLEEKSMSSKVNIAAAAAFFVVSGPSIRPTRQAMAPTRKAMAVHT